MLFYNISGAIHSNNISEILILFEYFRNMYSCHRHFTKYTLFAEKNVFIWKKIFFIEKNINENVKKYISFQKYIFTQKMFVL